MNSPVEGPKLDLFAIYAANKSKIDKKEMAILIDKETLEVKTIEGNNTDEKTGKKSLDIFQRLTIWVRTGLGLDRKIKHELIEMMDQEFKAIETETEELSKKIKEDVADEALSEEINEKVIATLAKLEKHKKELPSIKEKYTKAWEDITEKSSSLTAYGKLIAQTKQIDKATTPQEKIKAITNLWFSGMKENIPVLSKDEALHAKFSADLQALHLADQLASSTKELHENIESELNGLEKVFSDRAKELLEKPLGDIKDPLKGLKEKITFLENNDEKKAGYEAKVKAFEERLNNIDNVTTNNARQMVSKWETTKADFGREPINLPQLTNFIDNANQVFNSPLGPAVKEKIGKDIAETLQSVQTKLLEANKSITLTIQKNNKPLETLEKNRNVMQKLVSEIPAPLQELEELLASKKKDVDQLKTKSESLERILKDEEKEELGTKETEEKILQDYIQEDNKTAMRRPDAVKKEFDTRYRVYQTAVNQIQEEIKSQNTNKDPETIKLEDLLIPYQILEDLLEEKTKEWNAQAIKGNQAQTLPENILKLMDEVDKNKIHVQKLKKAITDRDDRNKGIKGNCILLRASIDKMKNERPQRLEETKMSAKNAKEQYEITNKEYKELADIVNTKKAILDNEKMITQLKPQIESQNEPLQKRADEQSAVLEKLSNLKLV